jgi:hypothetical protein
MTLFTDNPFEKMMIQDRAGGVTMRRPFPIPRLALPVRTKGSSLVWATV